MPCHSRARSIRSCIRPRLCRETLVATSGSRTVLRILLALAAPLLSSQLPAQQLNPPAASITRADTAQVTPAGAETAGVTAYPILFVTQVPIPGDFTSIGSVFGNHSPRVQSVGRGGDLWIRYANGALRNLTLAAGYGTSGFQGANSIAVREPCVHWDGAKAIFSMVIGAPTQQYQSESAVWQLYEITGLGPGQTPVLTRVPNQPASYNNVSPIYGSDDLIIFSSDRPRNGAAHLHPQLDEYEEAPTNTGLWLLNPASGELRLLNHAPSGNFTPSLDSYGRVLFTQWDHLQRDQQADTDAGAPPGQPPYGTFNWSSEAPGATPLLNDRSEIFPEPRPGRDDLLDGTNLVGHTFNHFFPWQMNEDGTDLEILNHLGRHELHGYIPASIDDDPNVQDFYGQLPRFNAFPINNLLQLREDPSMPGRYYGVDAPEFQTHAAGQVLRLLSPPALDADHIFIEYVTHRDTSTPDASPSANHSGLYRDPLPLSDGSVLVSHTLETSADQNAGTRANPLSLYDFRLKRLTAGPGGFAVGGAPMTGAAGITKTISYWDPDVLVSYSGRLWEWHAVEVRPRPRPPRRSTPLPAIEEDVFVQAGVTVAELRSFLLQQDLALIVARNVTTRDDFDLQQPFNLRVPGGVQTLGAPGRIYDVAHLQLFQADLIRGLSNGGVPRPGRRVLARHMHEPAALAANPPNPAGPTASARIAADGSIAAFVPARRALSWQVTGPNGSPVVRERNWLTFQAGEIRVCTSCHGPSQYDQAGHAPPANPPAALLALLEYWRVQHGARPGDMNCDGAVSLGDLGGFVLAVTNPAGYPIAYPNCNIVNADVNLDGAVTVSDIGPFVALLTDS